ncbi:MAG TPA: hypothetical protein VFK90_02855 [Anaeromyxobacter sp.]|nr:hypothetical protein [Anaeromyxobacter sp.]
MRHARSLLLGLAAALALATAARLPAAWESGNALNHVSGAWMTLAQDLADGTFYRPLHDPALGYGGTRFFPLELAIHAGLVRAGLPLLPAGYALSLAAVALVVGGAFGLLRRVGVPRAPALAFAALALAGLAVQLGASAVRGDLLPVGLSALGLAAVASRPRPGRLALAALFFALAFAAKPTSLTGAAAAVAWLAVRRQRGRAAVLGLATAALAAGVVLATDAASSGRFLGILRACASGGAGVRDALVAPWKLFRYVTVGDPSGLVLVAGAGATIAAAMRDLGAERRRAAAESPLLLPALWLGAAGAGLLGVLASPGTGVNHLVDVEVAAAAVLGAAWLAPGAAARVARLAGPAAAAAGLAVAVATFREDLASSRLLEARAVARALPAGAVLSEDPLVPIAAGTRPVLLDPWMLRLAGERDPALVRGLAGEIATGRYASIVLLRDLDDPEADAWFAHGNLGHDVAEEIRRTCRRAGGVGRYHVYVPRGAPRTPERAAPGREARGRPTPAEPAEDAGARVVVGTPPR